MVESLAIAHPFSMADSILQNRDYTIIMAKSCPDLATSPPGFADQWHAAQASILDLAQQCSEFDPDGITLYVAHQSTDQDCTFQRHEPITIETFETLVDNGTIPAEIQLAPGLQAALDEYFEHKAQGTAKANGQIILVVMNEEPKDRMAIANLIVKATQKIDDDHELGIGFVQIGENPIAQGFFEMLDDYLQEAGAKYDIVHTKILSTIQPDSLTAFLLDTLID